MHPSSKWPAASGGLAALAALGLFAPAPARAQTQDLFVTSGPTISRYAGTAPGAFSTTRTTFSTPGLFQPSGLAVDALGDLFTSTSDNGLGTIIEFTAGATPGTFGPVKTLSTPKLPSGLAVDAAGNLFVATRGIAGPNSGGLVKFTSTGPGTFDGGSLIASGLNDPSGVAVDAFGGVFTTNRGDPGPGGGTISEKLNGSSTILTSPSLNDPFGLAVDAGGDLFAANSGSNTITKFPSLGGGAFGAATSFSDPTLNGVLGLAFDAQGDLFAANNGNGTITKFSHTGPGTFAAGVVIETGVFQGNAGPFYLAFGPSVPAPVPEASGAVSLGLLLLFGAGGIVAAARKKRRA